MLGFVIVQAQQQPNTPAQGKSIEIIHSDFTDRNENEVPGAVVLTGNIYAQHDSIHIYCNKAYFFQMENYIKLFGKVRLIQNDTLQLDSNYAEYNGVDQIAYASGNVVMRSPDSKLTSDKVYYDRASGVAYYNEHAIITNKANQLKSRAGKYYTAEQKYEFRTKVEITNPETVINSEYLDYYEIPGHAYLFGPSTVVNKEHFIYTENGFYDTRLDIGKLTKNSYILTDNRRIEGDDMYYDKNLGYSRAVNHVKVTDTINKMVVTSHYADVYRKENGYDSIYMNKKPLVRMLAESDSTFFHAKNIIITGPEEARIMRGFPNARMFREPDMSGKADSIHVNQKIGLTQMIGKPVMFKGESQLTGKLIHLLNDTLTEKMDSIKVLTDAFMIEKDSLGAGYNQAKGINLYGRFEDNKIVEIDLIQNSEMIYYVYDEDDELTGIDKSKSSRINLELEDNKIVVATRYINPEAETYPPEDFPENARKFPGFNWRGEERILHQDMIFPPEELEEDVIAGEERDAKEEEKEKPMSVQEETINYQRKDKAPNKISGDTP